MSSTTQANTDTSAADWGFSGVVGGTIVAVSATVIGGTPITAWICTKCLFTGITAGVAAGGYKLCDKVEKTSSDISKKAIHVFKETAEKAEKWSNICMWGGISLLSAGLSTLNYYTIGKDCNTANKNDYCNISQNLFYLSSGVYAAALITTAVLGARYLHS